MNSLNQLSLSEAIEGLKNKKFSKKELVSAVLRRIEEIDNKLGSFLTLNNDAVKEASKKDLEKDFNGISGIPFAVKDVISTKSLDTTASSKILENYKSVYDATVVKRLCEKGGIVIGKTNCDAFAQGASTENSGYQFTKNPWNTDYVAGGSSGGSAAAVSADECIFSLGTDTGGSIRQPSSFCSISGLKPTYGACSRYGLLAMGSSFDCPGPMAKTVEDCKVIFDLIKGRDSCDATSVDYNKVRVPQKKDKIKVGLPKEFFAEGINSEVKNLVLEAAKKIENEGFLIEEISLKNTQYAVPTYYILIPSEISSNMARYDGKRFGKERELFEDEVKRRIMIGTYALSAGYYDQYYSKALKVRRLIQDDFKSAFEKVDVILGPVSPTPAFKFGEKTKDPLEMYLTDILTAGTNLAGIPGLALPCGFTKENLPVGMQILGPHYSEDLLFSVGESFQKITDWHTKKPKIK